MFKGKIAIDNNILENKNIIGKRLVHENFTPHKSNNLLH